MGISYCADSTKRNVVSVSSAFQIYQTTRHGVRWFLNERSAWGSKKSSTWWVAAVGGSRRTAALPSAELLPPHMHALDKTQPGQDRDFAAFAWTWTWAFTETRCGFRHMSEGMPIYYWQGTGTGRLGVGVAVLCVLLRACQIEGSQLFGELTPASTTPKGPAA